MKIKTITVEDFSKGMTNDIRDKRSGFSRLLKHFDILTRPNTLTAYHSMVDADSSASTNQITDFVWYSSNNVYAVGVNVSDSKTQVLTKVPGTAVWTAPANNKGAAGKVMVAGCFVQYHSKLYGSNTDTTIWSFDPAGGAFNNAETTLLSSASGNALVHSKDDVMYVPTANVVASNNNGVWTSAALTLPSRYTITALSEYGNYLAIACRSAIPFYGQSVVYLWDRDSTLNTLSESIDFGTGYLSTIQQIEGELIGISLQLDMTANLPNKYVFRKYSGGVADVFFELLGSVGNISIPASQKLGQRMYFSGEITLDAVVQNGIWGLGKNNAGNWAVWFDRLPNNDTTVALNTIKGFLTTGDYSIIAYNDGGWAVKETVTTGTYTGSSIIETVINPNMPLIDYSNSKQVYVVAVMYDKLPSGGQVIGKYKVNGGSWTTLFTETTVGKTITEQPVDATGTAITAGNEYQFRAEAKGGANITGIKYRYEVLDTLI